MKDLKTTNTFLLLIVIPLMFYLLKTLSFIFVPLVSAMFIALLLLPLMRWFDKKNVPKWLSVFFVVLLLIAAFKFAGELIKLTSNEIMAADNLFFEKAETKLIDLVVMIENFFGVNRIKGDNVLLHYFKGGNVMDSIGFSLDFISNLLSGTLMTAFFVVLLLSGSVNFEKLLNSTLIKVRHSSVKIFRKIEKDIIKFVIVKFAISLLTGVGFGLACLAFDVSFPIFWGLFAFVINFVQMIGSVISVVLLSLFAFVEIEPMSTLLFFVLAITAVQVLMGGVLEPVFMGKTFSVNVITILVMLMFWGYIWGIPGLILSIPITVFIKIILDQYPRYRVITELMSGGKSS
ncbi:AI-2E family transporter [Saccharicrinis fermentans]|uniref:Transport of quorum-sensing signal protein n=1 Tax=Saccharicrinis fermentans DSM 9555 = JCM 21142 TaxID=869213 RepID=W7YED7_9BACT|nr:AI-2E family transporter [Saccharicrinis fermentans]GAF02826.1 transport of quorum-sensing signal protein [Saccharicrinis fermentans DSM 9555 = JCM 21142]